MAECYGHCSVLHHTPQGLTDLETLWDLLQEGP